MLLGLRVGGEERASKVWNILEDGHLLVFRDCAEACWAEDPDARLGTCKTFGRPVLVRGF